MRSTKAFFPSLILHYWDAGLLAGLQYRKSFGSMADIERSDSFYSMYDFVTAPKLT